MLFRSDLLRIKNDLSSTLLVHTGNYLHNKTLEILLNYDSNYVPDKKFLFMCHNRRIHPHRFGLLCLLKKYDLLNQINWSYLRGYEIEERKHPNGKIWSHYLDAVFNEQDKIILSNEINFVSNIKIKKDEYELDYIIDDGKDNLDFNKSYEINTYKNSYIKIGRAHV